MTTEIRVTTDPVLVARVRIEQHLRALAGDLDGITGSLVASLDGRPIAADVPEDSRRQTAAIVASSVGLGERLADLTGRGDLHEIVVRSSSGYVVIYAVADVGALIVLTSPTINLAMLHHKTRSVTPTLATIIAESGLIDAAGADHP